MKPILLLFLGYHIEFGIFKYINIIYSSDNNVYNTDCFIYFILLFYFVTISNYDKNNFNIYSIYHIPKLKDYYQILIYKIIYCLSLKFDLLNHPKIP